MIGFLRCAAADSGNPRRGCISFYRKFGEYLVSLTWHFLKHQDIYRV